MTVRPLDPEGVPVWTPAVLNEFRTGVVSNRRQHDGSAEAFLRRIMPWQRGRRGFLLEGVPNRCEAGISKDWKFFPACRDTCSALPIHLCKHMMRTNGLEPSSCTVPMAVDVLFGGRAKIIIRGNEMKTGIDAV